MNKPDIEPITIQKRGESQLIDHCEEISMWINWTTGHAVYFAAYYEATEDRRDLVFWGIKGDAMAFPKIVFDDFNYCPSILDDKVQLKIYRDKDVKRIRLIAFNIDRLSADDTVPFHDIDIKVDVYLNFKSKKAFDIIPEFTGTGNFACLANIENVGESGVKFVIDGRVRPHDYSSTKSMDALMDFARDF